ncbi:DUF4652 domain-containing protein (plasmid) [Paenisporosarcina antarctica]|uniref:DUF4652 domain-containing protein n=1 Tax=Paenisporosarcina antarctica TaxID=417367 RepID=A0A4P7A2S3_9BACL|nr:DUF4652 domain-containing protein [Paenisporosarcina antarctica]
MIHKVMGFGSGTISIGGNVFIYNISTKKLSQLTHYDAKIQITKLKMNEIKKIHLNGIKYTDDNYSYFEEFSDEISL